MWGRERISLGYGKFFVLAICGAMPLLLWFSANSRCTQLGVEQAVKIFIVTCSFAVFLIAVLTVLDAQNHAEDHWRNNLSLASVFVVLATMTDWSDRCDFVLSKNYFIDKVMMFVSLLLMHRPVRWLTKKMFPFLH